MLCFEFPDEPFQHDLASGDVNPLVTVRARVGRTAAGTCQGRYRPIDIDRSPRDVLSRSERRQSPFHACCLLRKSSCRSSRADISDSG